MPKPRKNAPRFEDISFRYHYRDHGSCIFLGYAVATLVVPSALGKGIDLKLRFRGIQVKLLNGKARIDFPEEQSKDGRWYPHVNPLNAETRVALTDSLLADRMISAVLKVTLEDVERADLSRAEQRAATAALRAGIAVAADDIPF